MKEKGHATIGCAMAAKKTEGRISFLVSAYENEMTARADYLLTTEEEKNLPEGHPSFGILVLFSSRKQLKEEMQEVHLDWAYAGSENELADSAEDILTRDLGYSYQTLEDTRKEYRKCRAAAEQAGKNYREAEKKLHRLKTSLKNTQLQNEWLARENSSNDEKKKAAGKETEELTAKMEALHPQISSLQGESDKQEAEMIPLIKKAEEVNGLIRDLKKDAEHRKGNLKFHDKILHPARYKAEKQEITEIEQKISSLQMEIEGISSKRNEKDQKLEETRNRLRLMSNEYESLEKKKKESTDALQKHSNDLEGGSRMIDEGLARLKQVQSRIQYEESRLEALRSDALKKQNAQFESALVLIHTWIGWAEEYRSDLGKIPLFNDCKEEIPPALIEKEFFAPFIFAASGEIPQWLKGIHLNLLITDRPVNAQARKCFRETA